MEAWSRISRASFEATRMGEGWNGGQGADEGVEILVGNNDHRQRDGQHPDRSGWGPRAEEEEGIWNGRTGVTRWHVRGGSEIWNSAIKFYPYQK